MTSRSQTPPALAGGASISELEQLLKATLDTTGLSRVVLQFHS